MSRMKLKLHKCSSFFFCFWCVMTWFSFSVSAEESQPDVVRVGWYEDAYHITGENGDRSGYGYEYEQAVAAYTGWTYEYVEGGWSELLEKLKNGEIDLMGALSYTDERAETMLFSELPMGKEKYYLYADLAHTDISASDLSTLDGKRVDLMEESVISTQFYEWEEKNHVNLQPVFSETFEEGKENARNRKIDCVVSTETPEWVEFGMSAIAVTGGSDIYYGINPKRPDLKEKLDDAMRKMENDKPFYADELYAKYLSAASSPVLSKEEKEWLKTHGAIRIGYMNHDSGFSNVDEETGKPVGVINDYTVLAEDCLGNHALSFELVGFDSQSEQLQALKDKKIDMIFHTSQNPYAAEKNHLILSNTVLEIPLAALTTQEYFNENADNSIAITKGDLLLKWHVSYHYPQWNIVEYDSAKDMEKAVQDGVVDCFLVKSGQLPKYIEEKKFHSVFLTQACDTSFAVNREDVILMSILNKTLKTMQSSMLSGALSMYDNALKKVTIMDFVKDNLLEVGVASISVFSIILLLILRLLSKSRIAETKATELNKKLQESHRELEEALMQAESANAAKTTFLNNMSHDIRTPMNAIIGFTNIAKKQCISDIVKNCLEKINDSSELLLTLINDVLDISRIESGHMKYNPVATDITAVTDAALNVTSGLLLHRDLTFEVEREKLENPYVLADAVRIREVLVNILSNAVKFTDDGGIIRFVSSGKMDEEGKHLIVRYVISDTGIGMSSEFQKHIFDEFSQELSSDARTQYKGTGLGMAITKSYVDMMGGTISLQSEKKKGSVFTIELSLEMVEKEKAQKQSVPVDLSAVSGRQILLAEDNDLNAEIAMFQLEEAGIAVTRAADGKQAVAMFESHPAGTFDMILMDIMMPEMNGYQATAAIRNLAERPDGRTIPIVALTANAFAEDVQASMDAGMNDHLSKPIVMEELIKAIVRNLGK